MVVLPEPVGPGDQHGAVGLAVGLLVADHVLGQEPELGQVELGRAVVQDPHDDFFAVHRGQRRHPQVHRAAFDGAGDAAVFGDAALGNVYVGHDF